MLYAWFVFSIGLVGLLAASLTDIKTREVPDWLNFSLIAAGLGTALIASLVEWTYLPFVSSLLAFGAAVAIGYAMFYAGQWGGGDSKMLMALGALFPAYPALFQNGWLPNFSPFSEIPIISFFPFFTVLVINIALAGAFYGLCWSMVLAIKHRKRVIPKFLELLKKYKVVRFAWLFLFVIAPIFFYDQPLLLIFVVGLIAVLAASFYLLFFVKAVELCCMHTMVEPRILTEGDWIAKDVYVGKKYICGPKDLGIGKKQIKTLIALKKQGKIKKIEIKVGIPFVPSFLIAFVLTCFGVNIFLLLL